MIDPKDLETIREINDKLPFAHPIEQGEEPKTRFFWAPAGETYPFDPAAPKMSDIAGWTEMTLAFEPASFQLNFTREVLGDWS